jgi:hydrogenase/urease accessory protein HupE
MSCLEVRAASMKRLRASAVASFCFLCPSSALAHGSLALGDLYDGLLHPLMHLGPFLLVVAVAAAAGGLVAGRGRTVAGLVFILAAVVSSVAGFMGLHLPHVEGVSMAVAAVAGVMLAAAWSGPRPTLALLASAGGLCTGAWSVTMLNAAPVSPLFYLTGQAIGQGFLCLYVIRSAAMIRESRYAVALRVAGSWTAAIALMAMVLIRY